MILFIISVNMILFIISVNMILFIISVNMILFIIGINMIFSEILLKKTELLSEQIVYRVYDRIFLSDFMKQKIIS